MAQIINNDHSYVIASPSFIASLASSGLFRLELAFNLDTRAIVKIEFRKPPKLADDWTRKLNIYDV